MDGIEEIASENGYTTILASSSYDNSKLEAELNKFSNYVDGIILCTNMIDDKNIRRILRKGVSVVAIDIKIENRIVPSIEVDNYKAIYEGINYLVSLGHKNIYYFSEPLILGIIEDRLNAYKDCLKDNSIKLDESKIFIDERLEINKTKIGYEIMSKIVKNIKIPAVVFGTSDLMIIGAMKAAIENNFAIPGDISFLGYDNIFLCEYTNPPLSTIKQPKRYMGRIALKLLIDLISGKRIKEKRIFLEATLIKRSTVRNLKKE